MHQPHPGAAKRGANRGSFKPGPDPRRHEFTWSERRRGYENAIEGAGLKFRLWLRSKVAATARPETVARYKASFLAARYED